MEWRPGRATFEVDGVVTGEVAQAPAYPMQLIVGVFDFPDRPHGPGATAVPELVVGRVRITP